MISYFEANCPGCSRRLRVRAAYAGLSIVCNHCDQSFVAAPPEAIDPASATTTTGGGLHQDDGEASKERIESLEDEVGRLRSELSARAREAEEDADRANRDRERSVEVQARAQALEEEINIVRRLREGDARLLREVGACLADGDRLRSEFRDLSARLGAVEVAHAREAERVAESHAERDRLDRSCRELGRELERREADRVQLRADLAAAESSRSEARIESDEASRRSEADRLEWRAEAGGLRDAIDGADVERDALKTLLGSERAERGHQVEAFQAEARRLGRELDRLRAEGEATRQAIAGLARDRDRLADSLRRALAEAEDARGRHVDEMREMSDARSDAEDRLRVALDRLDEATGQLRSARAEVARIDLVRQDELREHRLALDAARGESDSERSALLDRIDQERMIREEGLSRLRVEIEASRGEADRLRVEVEGHRREIGKTRAEADELAAEHAMLRDRHEEVCRDREEWRSRCLAAEGLALAEADWGEVDPEVPRPEQGHPTGVGSVAAIGQAPDTCSCMAHADGGPHAVTDESDDVTSASQHDLTVRARTGEEALDTEWALPEPVDLASAREQVALLTDLLRTTQQANLRLSDRLAALKGTEATVCKPGELLHAEPPGVGSVARKERDEAAWHVNLAQRASRLAERRKSGRP